jgi:DNA-binding HxlR family transcriptional regulator
LYQGVASATPQVTGSPQPLREGERCFSELQTDITGVSAKMLTNCLRKLERDGVSERLNRPTSPPTVWYSLTPVGQEFCAALVNLIDIGQRLRRTQVTSL